MKVNKGLILLLSLVSVIIWAIVERFLGYEIFDQVLLSSILTLMLCFYKE